MADRVVIVDIRRGPCLVDKVDLAQMSGRAGRSLNGSGASAFVDIVVPENDEGTAENMLETMDSFSIASTFDVAERIAFHILPDISRGFVFDKPSAQDWMDKSFFCFMGRNKDDVFNALEILEREEAIRYSKDGHILVTLQGNIAASLYFHPCDIMAWRLNFEELFDRGIEDTDVGVAWALSSIPSQMGRATASGDIRECVAEFRNIASGSGLKVLDGTDVIGSCWWWIIGGPSVRWLKSEAYSLRKDFGRIRVALEGLNGACSWDKKEFIDRLGVRISKRVPSEIAPLFEIEGISKEVAFGLYNLGIGSLEELEEKMWRVDDSGDERLIRAVKKFIGSVS